MIPNLLLLFIDFQLNGSIMDEALTCQFYTPSPFIGANLIANGHLTNAQSMFVKPVTNCCGLQTWYVIWILKRSLFYYNLARLQDFDNVYLGNLYSWIADCLLHILPQAQLQTLFRNTSFLISIFKWII